MDHLQLEDGVLKVEADNPILFPKITSINNITYKYQHHLRKAVLVILSVSLLSFLLSLFTGLSFLHCYTYYISTFLLPLFTHTFERRCMFLICNGILIFLARKSGLHGAQYFPSGLEMEQESDDDIHPKMMMNVEQHLTLQPAQPVDSPSEVAAKTSMQGEVLEIQQAEENAAEDPALQSEAEREPAESDFAEDVKIEEQKCGLLVGAEDDDGESEGSASNTEELNKKIEEFIRKMKEELKLETQQQQLIAA